MTFSHRLTYAGWSQRAEGEGLHIPLPVLWAIQSAPSHRYLICIDRRGSIFLTALIHTDVCCHFVDTVNQYYIKCYLQFTLNCLK